MNYVIWKEKDSREVEGLIICELPPISKPNLRVNETVIDGVDGSTVEELGYESYDKPLLIGLRRNADIDEIINFFTGDGEIVFSNEPDKYYKAKIISSIDFARLCRLKTATVTFRVQPFKYDYEEDERVSQAGRTDIIIDNIGNYFSKPIMTIQGTGEVRISVNDEALFKYTFPEDENTVVIDSEKQDAYLGVDLKNRNMAGEFPTLRSGINTVTWEGAVDSIKIEKYSRWL